MTIEVAKPKHRYVALDSLRGVCACMVLWYHIPSDSWIAQLPLVRHGGLFVDFFFVLSGFVIGSSYGDRLAGSYSIKRYMTLRFFRIYPLHLAVLLAYLAFEIVFATLAPGSAGRAPFEGGYSPGLLIASLLLVQPFVGPDWAPWNGPSWSIAVEFWTYLIFGAVIKALPRLIVPLCIAVAVVAPVYLALLTDRNIAVFHDGALARCLYGFAMGVLCWKIPAKVRETDLPRWQDNFFEIATVLLCGALAWQTEAGRLSLLAPPVFAIAVVVFSRQRGIVSSLLKRAPFVALGTLSYSIYMVHVFLLWRFINVLGVVERKTGLDLVTNSGGVNKVSSDPLIYAGLALIFFAGVVVTAWLSWRFIERPGQELGRR